LGYGRLEVVDAIHLERRGHAGIVEPHARSEFRTATAIVELVTQTSRAVRGDRGRLRARGFFHNQHRVACRRRALREGAAGEHETSGEGSKAQHVDSDVVRSTLSVMGLSILLIWQWVLLGRSGAVGTARA